jgi:hypothetical protein
VFESLDAVTRRDDDAPDGHRLRLGEKASVGGGGRDVRRALWVALVVGSVLNVINQGDALFSGGAFDWIKAALTYVVPFFVSLHDAAQARRP